MIRDRRINNRRGFNVCLQLRNPQRGISDVHSEVIDLNPVELLQGNLYRRVRVPQRENSLIPQNLRKNLVL